MLLLLHVNSVTVVTCTSRYVTCRSVICRAPLRYMPCTAPLHVVYSSVTCRVPLRYMPCTPPLHAVYRTVDPGVVVVGCVAVLAEVERWRCQALRLIGSPELGR